MAFSVILRLSRKLLIVSGHTRIFKVSVVVDVVDDKTLFFSMSVASNFTEHFRGLAREHRAVDDFNESEFGHCCI